MNTPYGGSWQTTSVELPQTSPSSVYGTFAIGSYTFNAANNINSVALATDNKYMCFRELCVSNGSGARIGVAEELSVNESELIVSPNPNNGEFQAGFYVEVGRRAPLSVSDMMGREVWKKKLIGQGLQQETVHLSSQSVGTYILSLQKEATKSSFKTESKKVLVVK